MNSKKYNHIEALLLLVFAIFTILLGSFNCLSATAETTKSQKTIRVVMDDNYPPYVFKDDKGHLKGIIVDQWGLWEKKTGILVELTGMDWGDAQRRMQAGEFDVIDTLFRNEQRDRIYEFSKPYAQLDVPLFFHVDISGIRGPDDLKGFLVAVKAGDSSIEVLKKHGVTSIIEYSSYEKLIESARAGKTKVFTVDRPPALYFLNKMGIQNLFRETKPLYHGEFHRAVLKGRTDLLDVMEKGFADISKADYAAIDKLWMGSPLKSTPYLKFALYCLGGITAIAVLLAIWLRLLKQAVLRKTDELRKSEERHRAILQTAMDGIWLVDMQGHLLEVNEAYCRMSGYSMQELLTMSLPDLEVNKSSEETAGRIRRIMELGELRFESRHRCKNGTVIDVEVSTQYREDHGGQCVAFIRDISERKQAEEEKTKLTGQLHQSQKMESVGRLAGGVAHDFNNMLGVIFGHAEMALMRMDPGQPLYASLTEISKAAQRSADLTRQLLAFARKQTVAPKVIDLNEAVAGMLIMLHRLIGENIHLAWQPGVNLWPVMMDNSQIDQIMANLSVNARDSIAGIGHIIIETENCSIDDYYFKIYPYAAPGDYVKIVVSDDGAGMDSETQEQIFEPFFTTKEVGGGTGLGLATVYGIVRQNNGFINVCSEVGRGTTFTIYLPRCEGKGVPVQKEDEAASSRRGHETILLVEDEPQLLEMTRLLLTEMGYVVLKAGSPDEAISLAREHNGEIDLLMTDVIMPEMNGWDLAKNLLTINPELKSLFMSGYTADIIAHHGVLEEGIHFIQKPFRIDTLSAKLREVLDVHG